MAYAFVQDVASSWDQYERVTAGLVEPAPSGLILHVAGPTDEGFRIIDVCESELPGSASKRSGWHPRSPPSAGRPGLSRCSANSIPCTSW